MEDFMSAMPRRFHSKSKIDSPQFTRRHYIWLTNTCRNLLANAKEREYSWGPTEDCIENAKLVVNDLAEALATDNPHFDKQQFLDNIFNPTSEPK
jgi:hypothetical protein